MKRINEHIFLSFLAVLTLLCTACITGGWEECPSPDELDNPNNLIIRLTGQRVQTYAESADWHNAMLFVLTKDHDGKDSVAATRQLDMLQPQPQKLSVKDLGLQLGDTTTYSFAVWFNLKEKEKKSEGEGEGESESESDNELPYTYILDKDTVYMQLPENGLINTDEILPFFHGLTRQRLHSRPDSNNIVPITVVPQTNVLNIKIFGKNVVPKIDGESYRFEISDNSGIYSLDNKLLKRPEFFYYVAEDVKPDEGATDTVRITMRVLKLSTAPDAPSPKLTVANDARQVFGAPDKTDLVLVISESYRQKYNKSIDIDAYHTFDIAINLDEAHGMTITVNDWAPVSDDYILDL